MSDPGTELLRFRLGLGLDIFFGTVNDAGIELGLTVRVRVRVRV